MSWIRYPHRTRSHKKEPKLGTKWHQKRHQILSSLRAIWRRRCLNSGAFCNDLRVQRNFYRCKGGRGFLWIRLRRDMGLAERGTSKPASDCCVYIPPSSHRMKEVRDKVVNRSYGARLGDRCECRCCGWLFRKRKAPHRFLFCRQYLSRHSATG